MNLLIKFFSILFRVLGQFSPFVAIIARTFFTSFNVVCKSIDPGHSFIKYVVCSKCNQIYVYEQCIHKIGTEQCSKKCDFVMFPRHTQLRRRQPCGDLLLKTVEFTSKSTKKTLYPFKVYCYKSLSKSMQNLLLRKEFILNCSLWKHKQSSSNEIVADIYDGRIWKEFQVYNGDHFLDKDYSFAFILNVDWFQPYLHTQASVGVIYLTVLNLPHSIRYKRENIILIGLIPGPSEPKKHINSFLKPLVEELIELWKGAKFSVCTSSGIKSEFVRGAILCVSCDLPAASKTCGFLGHAANLSCSKCLKVSPGEVGNKDYSGFDRSDWLKRDNNQHREAINKILKCETKTKKEKMESRLGCRYSCLIDLPYFDATRMLCIDPMHNLFLGTGEHMLSIWIEQGWLNKKHFLSIQKFVDDLILPSDIGRIPNKIESGFSGFKADQFKSWILIYSIPALYSILPIGHLECWRHFILACQILCKQKLTVAEIDMADLLLLRFCNKVQELYGRSAVTPNMHLHCHLKDIILDYGPVQEFWLFSFERYNGILGNQPTNNRAIEEQLMKRFIRDNMINYIDFPEEFKSDFSSVLTSDKLIGSVGETLMTYTEIALPTKYTREAFDCETKKVVQKLIQKVNQASDNDEVNVNSIFLQYSSLTIKGKTFSSSKKYPFIAQANWKEEYYGAPPTPLTGTCEPSYRLLRRPVEIRNFLIVNYSINTVRSINNSGCICVLDEASSTQI